MDAFVRWLLGKNSQQEVGSGSGRSFRRHTSWCWNVDVPQPAPLREVPRQIMVDGTYFADWCVLVAHDGQAVIAWQWCNQESKTAWGQLIKRLPAPDVVVTDGGAGLRSALDTYWPDTKVQRCYFHIYATVRRHTTLKPRLQAGKEILALTRQLMHVSDLNDAAAWMSDYAAWETRWADLLAERTYASRNSERPTSRLEGGPNNAIKYLLRHHRGLRNHHAPRAIDWLLNSLTEHPHDPWQLAKSHLQGQATTATQPPNHEPAGPDRYGTGLTPEEGLWTKKGWAGH